MENVNSGYGRFVVSPEVQKKLLMSSERAKRLKTRVVHCPICTTRFATVGVDQKGIIWGKCQKCKWEGALDLAYFRTERHCPEGTYYRIGNKQKGK